MTQVALTGMPGYPGAPGALNTLTGTEYFHAVQNQSGTEVDVAIPLNFFKSRVNILMFGADPTGAADSTTAMTAAHATGSMVYYPAGTYKFSTFSFAAGGICGDGQGITILNSTDTTTADLITFTGTGSTTPAYFRDFTIEGSGSKTTGAALRFNAASGVLTYPNITNVQFSSIPTGVYTSNTAQFVIDQCNFINYADKGVHIEDNAVSDEGDSSISNCVMNTSVPNGSCHGIWHRSGGGLKVSNVKILGGNNGYVMGWIGGTGAADLSISNCSFESPITSGFGIFLGRDSGTGGIGSVMISNSEMGFPTGIATDSSGFLTLISIDGNVLNVQGTTSSFFGIALNNVSNISIGQNVINAQNAGSPIGVSITSSCSNGKIAPQIFTGMPAASRVSNASTSVIYEEVSQTGTAGTITTSTAYGALFEGSVAVTFPQAYSVAPKVMCNVSNGSAGAVSAWAAGVSTTGFTATVVGVTSGGSVTGVTWATVGGVI